MAFVGPRRSMMVGGSNPLSDGLSFGINLQKSISDAFSRGSSTPTFTRASTAHMWALGPNDVASATPTIVTLASGEPGFWGARRIAENDWSILDANGLPITAANGASSFWADAGGPFGYFSGGARADVLGTTTAIRRTMTDVGWVIGATATVGAATGADGVASAGFSFTFGAVAATNTALFTTVLGAAVRTFSVLARRKTGSGVVSMTVDNGVTWTPITLTANYKQFSVVSANVANQIVGFKGDTNLDAIEGDFLTLETAAFANPTPIPVNVSKAADALTYASAGNVQTAQGSMYAETVTGNTSIQLIASAYSTNSATDAINLYLDATTLAARMQVYSGTVAYADVTAGTNSVNVLGKIAAVWNTNLANSFSNGTAGTADTSVTVPSAMTTIALGGSGLPLFGTIRNVRIWGTALPTSTLQALTNG